MEVTSDYVLPCGRDVEQVWEVVDLSDSHTRSCPHCAAVRESLLVLRASTEEMVREEVEPPSDLVSRVMSAVRADVRRSDVVPLPGDGLARISTRAVAAVLRYAADGVDGVRARGCRVTEAPESTAADPVIEVELGIAITAGVTAEAYEEVRRRVLAAGSARIGVRLARLDLVVSDVLEG
ncbi:Asp23/Gls24 family envelope stress response protein [Lentzea sp.]|uniref:Asp23/Gls24 family envelope stress response protein n=1 Tax=Lentzea sp. TaxID=56099 RepID=UPI002BEF8110|nr:Asp23/Gls24 family envelope stress response protein [Lentzea sp.]HUQ61741.1 Asp23/Gls24 family envelope stress response protein [Lentzea sp.]